MHVPAPTGLVIPSGLKRKYRILYPSRRRQRWPQASALQNFIRLLYIVRVSRYFVSIPPFPGHKKNILRTLARLTTYLRSFVFLVGENCEKLPTNRIIQRFQLC